MTDAVVEGSKNFDRLGFFTVHPNLSPQAYRIFTSIGNAATATGTRSPGPAGQQPSTLATRPSRGGFCTEQ